MDRRYTRRGAVERIGGVLVGMTTAGCSAGGGRGGRPTVDMTDDLRFEPASITVSAGDTVVWRNVGSVRHTVTAYGDRIPDAAAYFASGGFGSETAARDGYPGRGSIAGEESYRHAFAVAGTYEYFCIPHERAGMRGTVEVTG